MLPLSRMVNVATSVAGPLYLAAVKGVLIGRFASSLDRQSRELGRFASSLDRQSRER